MSAHVDRRGPEGTGFGTAAFEAKRQAGNARQVEERRREANALFDEAERMLDEGFAPDVIAADLGTTIAALARRAYRYGRTELGQTFESARGRSWVGEWATRPSRKKAS